MPRPPALRRSARLPVTLLALAVLAACGDTPEAGPDAGPSSSLAPAAVPVTCTGDAGALIDELFPAGAARDYAVQQCARIQHRSMKGKTESALLAIEQFIEDLLLLAAQGRLNTPSMGTIEEAMGALVAALYADAGIAVGVGEIGVGEVDESGGTVASPSMHAAIEFAPGDLGGDTWVTIVPLPLPGSPGDCPFGFPVNHDCYPLYYDVTIHPAGNLIDPATLGFCVLDSGPFAPPSMTVADRLQIASRDHVNPGQIVFWPVSAAPGAVDCSDLAFAPTGWQGRVWDALGPFAGLFEVTPAFANPGKLGASISSFTPFAAADPVPNTAVAPALFFPGANAIIPQNNPDTAFTPSSCSFGNGTWGFMINFDWADVGNTGHYDIELQHNMAAFPALSTNTPDSEYQYVECSGFITDTNLIGWEWRVRAVDVDSMIGPWSAPQPIQFSKVNVSTNGKLGGFVRDADTDAPIPNAEVEVLGPAIEVSSGANGLYQLSGVTIPCCTSFAGGGTVTYTVEVRASGYSTIQETVTWTTGRPLVMRNFFLGEIFLETF